MTPSKLKFLLSPRLLVKSNYYIFRALRYPLGLFGYYKGKRNAQLDDFWKGRIDTVVQAPDNKLIKRVPLAGEIIGDVQIMHNGIKIHVGSYYGDGNTVLIYKNKGVHEPQEEKAFDEVLSYMPDDGSMLEVGAFWGFYSMSFQHKIKNGVNYLVEPDLHALESGINNFKLNGLKGIFFNYFISDRVEPGDIPTITIDRFLEQNNIRHLNILHSDIQGFELKMLQGATKHLSNGGIDYLFISTHSNELHESCKDFLKRYDFIILCDCDLNKSYSWDGILVARSKFVAGPDKIDISFRNI